MARVPLTELVFAGTSPVRPAVRKSVNVYKRGTTEKITLYAAETGEATVAQPLATDPTGLPVSPGGTLVWVDNGSYDISVAGIVTPWEAISGGDIKTIKEGYINVEWYGADGTGTNDSTAAFKAAIAALPAEGGEIYAPRKYKLSEELNLDVRRSIKIRGNAAITAGNSAASQLVFTQAGGGTLISARSSVGIILEDIRIWPTNPLFTGKLLDLGSDGTHGQNTYSRLTNVYLNGPGDGIVAGTGLYIPNTADLVVEGCSFAGLEYAIKGEQIEADNSIGITILGGSILNCGVTGIQNAGESWNIQGTNVEALSNGSAGFIIVETGITPRNLHIDSVWMGDANSSGTWIIWRGIGLEIDNATFGGGELGVNMPDTEITKTNIVTIKGSRFVCTNAIRANWAGGNEFSYDINPNNFISVSGKKVSLDNGTSDLGSGKLSGASGIRCVGSVEITDAKFTREAASLLGLNAQLRILGGSGGYAFVIRKSSDESARLRISEEAKVEFGGGTSTTIDTNLYRKEAKKLKTDNTLQVGEEFAHQGTKVGLYNVTPVARAAAIASPAAEATALKTAVDKLREALKNIGITE